MKSFKLISIVIPVHNEADNIDWHHKLITETLRDKPYKHELIYVDDGSSDNSLLKIQELTDKNSNVSFVSFSRNFGKEAATTAGLKHVKGDAALIIDADGQHPIETIDKFVDSWLSGNKIVIGIRTNDKGEGIIKTAGSKLFYSILKLLGGDNSTKSGLTDFRLLDRQVIDEYNKLTEHNRITRNLIDWLGFKRQFVPFVANKRHAGKASYSYRKLGKLALDGIIKHSTRPLKIIGLLGMIVSLMSLIVGLFVIIEMYVLNDPLSINVSGSASLAIWLSFMVGVVLICQGLLALYMENVYYETQNRPLFIIGDSSYSD